MRLRLSDALKILYVDHNTRGRKELLKKYGFSADELATALESGNFRILSKNHAHSKFKKEVNQCNGVNYTSG